MEGYQTKIREALKAIWKEVYHYAIEEDKQDFAHLQEVMLEDPPEYKDLRNSFLAIARLVDAALSEPDRQCDVGTAEEQARRYKLFCENHSGWDGQKRFGCLNCPFIDVDECEFAWAQMPYSEGE